MIEKYNDLIVAICETVIEDYTKAVAKGRGNEKEMAIANQNGAYILRGYWFKVLYSEEERERILNAITERAENGEYYKYGKGWRRV